MYKITTNSAGHVTAAQAITKSDITALGIPAQDTNTWIAMKALPRLLLVALVMFLLLLLDNKIYSSVAMVLGRKARWSKGDKRCHWRETARCSRSCWPAGQRSYRTTGFALALEVRLAREVQLAQMAHLLLGTWYFGNWYFYFCYYCCG